MDYSEKQEETGQAGWWKFREGEELIKRNSLWPPGWHSRRLRDLWEVFVFDISEFPTSLFVDVTVSWARLLLTCLNLEKSSGWLLFVWTFFFSLTFLSQLPLLMMPLCLHPVGTKYFPVLLCTTKLAQSTFQHYSDYKACTKYFPVLLRTDNAWTKFFSVLLCTTKLAQSSSQYCFVLRSLHKVLLSTSSYYEDCTKYFPVLLRTT